MNLDDVLSGAAETPEPIAAPEPVAGTVAAEPAAESAPEPTPEPKAEPRVEPKQDMTERERAFLTKANDEKTKRQELERRLAALEQKQPEAPKEEPKQFWDDPDAAIKQIEQLRHSLRQEVSQEMLKSKMNTAEYIARAKYKDFDENVVAFQEIISQAPGLQQQWLQSQDPAEFAYQTGKNHRELKELGDIGALRAKLEKEIRIKVEAELKGKFDADLKTKSEIPRSLTDAQSVSSSRPVWSGPDSLDNILHS